MSTLTNWIAINKRNDSLSPVFARTSAAWVRAFEQELQNTDFMQLLSDLEAHVNNFDNPHQVSLPQIASSMLKSLWDWYVTGMAPYLEAEYKIPSFEAFEEIMVTNPIVCFQIMRDCILNNVYQYQDMVGYRYTQPFYLLENITPIKQTPPLYYADSIFPDVNMRYYNSLSSLEIGNKEELKVFSVFFSFNMNSSTTPWTINLNTTSLGNAKSFLQCEYTPSTQSLEVSFNSNVWNTPPIFPTSSFSLNPNNDAPLELRGVIQYDGSQFHFFYSAGGVFTEEVSQGGALVQSGVTLTLNAYTLSHPFWDTIPQDAPSTKAVYIYPYLTPMDFTEVIFSRS